MNNIFNSMLDLVSSLETWQLLTSGYRQNRAQYFSGAYIPEFVDGLCIHSEGWVGVDLYLHRAAARSVIFKMDTETNISRTIDMVLFRVL